VTRRDAREHLRALQRALPPEWIAAASAKIARRLDQALPGLRSASFAFTWPLPGEPDLREAASRWVAAGACAALPDTVKGQPLTFRPWTPGCAMRAGVWNIPVPDTSRTAVPTVLLIPCLGYDCAGYRLGNGGGFYDRTLAALTPRPLAVGVGWSHAVLPSIGPQPHDIPMDLVVTERALIWHRQKPGLQPLTAPPAVGI
jgi:5-formyltetrahydrofolate cyclo-ligase